MKYSIYYYQVCNLVSNSSILLRSYHSQNYLEYKYYSLQGNINMSRYINWILLTIMGNYLYIVVNRSNKQVSMNYMYQNLSMFDIFFMKSTVSNDMVQQSQNHNIWLDILNNTQMRLNLMLEDKVNQMDMMCKYYKTNNFHMKKNKLNKYCSSLKDNIKMGIHSNMY